MANPSDVPASAAGTEILRRVHGNLTAAGDLVLINGVANHTYTILSVIITNKDASATETVNMVLGADGQTTNAMLLDLQTIGPKETFIWNDKFVMSETDELVVSVGETCSVNFLVSYIEQRWA